MVAGTRSLAIFLVFALSWLMSGCCGSPKTTPIEHVVMKEEVTENGFDVDIGYHTTAPHIIAHVTRTWTLKVNDQVVRTGELEYWEWFKMGRLPSDGTGWDPAVWNKVAPWAGRPFFLFDRVLAGPGLVATPPPDRFEVTIVSTHELHTDGQMQGVGAGQNADFGSYGYFDQDASGQGPSAKRKDDSGNVTHDDTQGWRTRFAPAGSITSPGNKVLTMTFEHVGGWAQNQAPLTQWSVEWKYDRSIGADTVTRQGAATESTPQNNP